MPTKAPADRRTVPFQLKLSPREDHRMVERHATLPDAPPLARWAREVLMEEVDNPRAGVQERLSARIAWLEMERARLERELAGARWQVRSLLCARNEPAPTPSVSDVEGELAG